VLQFLTILLNIVFFVGSLFLILLVLIQRGKGGGLAGAFGGMGGSSAFGTRAGDTFTRITVAAMIGWICVAMVLVKLTAASGSKFQHEVPPEPLKDERPAVTAPPEEKGEKAPGTDKPKSGPSHAKSPAKPAAPPAKTKPASDF
jgi:preprotein translocase subunit SecG